MGFIIFLAVVVIVIAIIAGSVKSNNVGRETTTRQTYNNNGPFQQVYTNKTKKVILKESAEKYERISNNKREQYLRSYKKKMKAICITLISVSFSVYLLFIVLSLLNRFTAFNIVMLVLFFIVVIVSIINLFMLVRREEKKLTIKAISIELSKIYKNLTNERVNKFKHYVWSHSKMCKDIADLNNKYEFNRDVCREHGYRYDCKSKRELENFNYDKWIINFMAQNEEFFETFQSIYSKDNSNYNKYVQEYRHLEKYTNERDIENIDLDYETFHACEYALYKEKKQSYIVPPSIKLNISYVSPSGRNSYSDKRIFFYDDLVRLVKLKQEEENKAVFAKQQKEKLAQEKRAKEKKLRELDKLESKLAQREKEINEREKEFLEATKEHIYTTEKIEVNNREIEIDENLSLSQKLKLLKEKYDNGEITYEEYQAKRKELM